MPTAIPIPLRTTTSIPASWHTLQRALGAGLVQGIVLGGSRTRPPMLCNHTFAPQAMPADPTGALQAFSAVLGAHMEMDDDHGPCPSCNLDEWIERAHLEGPSAGPGLGPRSDGPRAPATRVHWPWPLHDRLTSAHMRLAIRAAAASYTPPADARQDAQGFWISPLHPTDAATWNES